MKTVKTVGELRELVGKDEIKIEGTNIIVKNNEGDMDFHGKKEELIAWVSRIYKNNRETMDVITFVDDNIPKEEKQQIYQFVGKESAPDPKNVDYEENTDALIEDLTERLGKAEGKAEAYENILLGRELNIGK